ncbi:hypothetical protein N7466_007059 [Penicillium verhagenii]|uniref:uncharacterized protein n=1 Tax=Penicillium verhagenii TaxID=1562060 RepID=UPI00254543C1|nr:uncharacterized protein N7466_007059 [Penicillium verhagenii]KAJ5928103.1 hypothetical protein N7466_007059 [Penicillium verhagenii]
MAYDLPLLSPPMAAPRLPPPDCLLRNSQPQPQPQPRYMLSAHSDYMNRPALALPQMPMSRPMPMPMPMPLPLQMQAQTQAQAQNRIQTLPLRMHHQAPLPATDLRDYSASYTERSSPMLAHGHEYPIPIPISSNRARTYDQESQ